MQLSTLAAFVAEALEAHRYPHEQDTLFRASARCVGRIGLALDPGPAVTAWVIENNLDALFLHRVFQLDGDALPADVGIVACHLPFDEHLTPGYSPLLAGRLGLEAVTVLGEKEGRPVGMMGSIKPLPEDVFVARLFSLFGGLELVMPGGASVSQVAVVGAMTEALVREASGRGADVYVTGQMRAPARAAVQETGLGVVAVGHRRGEEYGLRLLAEMMRERFPELDARVFEL